MLAPLIIPIIQLQTPRAKNHINTNTPVSIKSGNTNLGLMVMQNTQALHHGTHTSISATGVPTDTDSCANRGTDRY